MNTLFSRPFENIGEKDLNDLVEVKKVREYISLDYKLTAYQHNHNGAVNLLADITAMANSRGGYIIIGIEEESLGHFLHQRRSEEDRRKLHRAARQGPRIPAAHRHARGSFETLL
jgi:predicted HTH transcriptional regulator